MKKTRKVFALVLVMLVLAAVMAPATLAAGEERIVAYVQVPEDWAEPCFWAWDADGNNAFAAWPGGAAEADPGNEGWYYCWLPNWVTSIIVNANAGEVQTGEIVVDAGKNVWITVASPEEATAVYEAQTQGEAPAYVEKIAIHAKVPADWSEANLWAWLAPDGTNAFAAWPGEAMALDDSGWYTAQVPAWINSVIINAGDGNPQTEDLTVEPKEMWVVVADDGTAEVNYENPDLAVANITVRVKAPADWASPCLWAWSHPDGTNAFAAWPGEPLVETDGWFTLEAPGWINSVIVNANEGSVQTGDLTVDVGKDIWVVVTDAENAAVSYEEPADLPPPADSGSAPASSVPASSSQAAAPSGNNTLMWILIGAGAAAVVVVVIIVAVVRSKKKK